MVDLFAFGKLEENAQSQQICIINYHYIRTIADRVPSYSNHILTFSMATWDT